MYSMKAMRKKDTLDAVTSTLAVMADACAILGGFLLATWIRFDSGWLPLRHGRPTDLYVRYLQGGAVATVVFLFVFHLQGLFVRPQTGSFSNKIPRIIKAVSLGILCTAVMVFAVQNEAAFARLVVGLSWFTIAFLVLVERFVLFRLERALSRRSRVINRVLVLGTDGVAARLCNTLAREPMLRSRVVGCLRTGSHDSEPKVAPETILGDLACLNSLVEAGQVDQVILADSRLDRDRVVEIILLCERNLVEFNMVPDLFRLMTRSMDVQTLDDIPLLGVNRWPLDKPWNRVLKRTEDIVGALIGLVISAPIILWAAILIKRSSPGPVFFVQERCGEHGKPFRLYKLRTMNVDAEAETGPVFARKNDPRVTPIGAFLRSHNLDELPQLWNVLKGEMSLVGPRPERPCFVEQFKEAIGRYMWRHMSKPGMTGWAQVNGLRGDTSIEERVKYDLYYLENWSLALDFKIIAKTFFARENAY
ncbi:MAG: undecaprenyl-phosphate glucose phosphotransferase [Verrucomicrobiae bacterium]|nr:undecaprenyl-phosphate glucose phosphotransferase [Verrucomicrobiae bacterium]